MIKFSPIKLADVMTGLDITVTSVTGLQCEKGSEMATIKFVEGLRARSEIQIRSWWLSATFPRV